MCPCMKRVFVVPPTLGLRFLGITHDRLDDETIGLLALHFPSSIQIRVYGGPECSTSLSEQNALHLGFESGMSIRPTSRHAVFFFFHRIFEFMAGLKIQGRRMKKAFLKRVADGLEKLAVGSSLIGIFKAIDVGVYVAIGCFIGSLV